MRSEMSGISSIVCPRNFSQRSHSPHKVILFEEPLMSTFRKHIVFPPTDVSGWSCGGEKMLIFEKVWSWIPPDPRRDLRDPRKKRPFLRPKSVFPLHALKPLQIWAETAQGARRTVRLKRAHKIHIPVKKNCLTGVLNLAWGLIYAAVDLSILKPHTLPIPESPFSCRK